MWALSPQIAKIANFWYKFTPKGLYPLKQFLRNAVWGRESLVRTFTPNFTIVILKM